MPIRFVRYKPDHQGISDFLHGEQLDEAVSEACQDIIAICKPQSSTLAPYWYHERGPNVTIGAYSRLSRNVRNDHRAAAAIEFGSGSAGEGAGQHKRRQGGLSNPKRILARAGDLIGERRGGEIG